jgi:hypothetical protein
VASANARPERDHRHRDHRNRRRLLGGFVAAALFDADPLDEFHDISTWLTTILGAIVLLVLYRIVVDRGGHGRTLRT